MKRTPGPVIAAIGPALLIVAGALAAVGFLAAQRDPSGPEQLVGVQPLASAASAASAGVAAVGEVKPAGTITRRPGAPERTTEAIIPCSLVVLPEEGVGEADFDVDGANGILGIHFSDVRNGRYRNVSYTIEYLDDPTCRSCPEVAELIDRVDPPAWRGGMGGER